MAITSGIRHALSEAASWLCAGAILVGGVIYHQEIRASLGGLMGIEQLADDEPVAPRGRLSDAELRARSAEARAAEAEARARNAELRAKQQHAAVQTQGQRGDAPRGRQGYGGIVELQARRDGHYYADAELNGSSVRVMVDTGATSVALTYEDAQRAGISVSDSDFTGRTNTANGEGRYAPVTITSIAIGSITVHNVRGVVLQRGKLGITLLGMSFLNKLSRAEMSNGTLVLEN